MASEMGITPNQAGAHGGELETSLMLAYAPEMVDMSQTVEGFTGELSELTARVMSGDPTGLETLDPNGIIGDPRPATKEAGFRYMEDWVNWAIGQIEAA
jgi:creatinine amidohydrolase